MSTHTHTHILFGEIYNKECNQSICVCLINQLIRKQRKVRLFIYLFFGQYKIIYLVGHVWNLFGPAMNNKGKLVYTPSIFIHPPHFK